LNTWWWLAVVGMVEKVLVLDLVEAVVLADI